MHHDNIVPYTYTQGFKIGENIEIFIPLYDGNLCQLTELYRPEGPATVRAITDRMHYQILDALGFVHTYNPQIIHRDIKPANILYRHDKVRQNGEQMPKVDIYGLGITFVECLEELPPEAEREVTWQHWEQWHRHVHDISEQSIEGLRG